MKTSNKSVEGVRQRESTTQVLVSKSGQTQVSKARKAVLLVIIAATQFSWAGDTAVPASAPNQPGRSAAGSSFEPAFSADGTKIVFVSTANNLVLNDNRGLYLDVFIRDLMQRKTTLVSVDGSGVGGADQNALAPSISSTGHRVAFASAARNLVPGHLDNATDIFVRDLVAGTTFLVSMPESGNGPALGDLLSQNTSLSDHPLISGDGHLVVFESGATNLVSGADTNRAMDVFLRDLDGQTNCLITVSTTPGQAANRSSSLEGITPDGQKVLFASGATDLVAGVPAAQAHIYVRDLGAATTLCVSAQAFVQHPVLVRALLPVICTDGSRVAFKAVSGQNAVLWFHHDLASGQTLLVSSNFLGGTLLDVDRNLDRIEHAAPTLSGDGRFMAYEANDRIYVWDAQTQSSLLITQGEAPLGVERAKSPVLSSDGKRVAFVSNLAGGSPFSSWGIYQMYVHDLELEQTRLVSMGLHPAAVKTSDLQFTIPALSPDGSKVAFATQDPDLVAEDCNAATDVFAYEWTRQSASLVTPSHAALPATTGTGTGILSASLVTFRHAALPAATGTGLTRLDPGTLSHDGRVVAFSSIDTTFIAGDTNRWQDGFVHDFGSRQTVPITLYSNVNSSLGLSAASGSSIWLFQTNGPVGRTALSADGSSVVLELRLIGNIDAEIYELFLWDNVQCTLRLITRTLAGIPPAWDPDLGKDSQRPSLSYNGKRVAFQSNVQGRKFDNTTGDSGLTVDVFLFYADRASNPIVMISKVFTTAAIASGGNADSTKPLISPDGMWVAYSSLATDLTTQTVSGGVPRVYLWHELTRSNRLVSCDAQGAVLNEPSSNFVFSANGQYLFFDATTTRTIYRHNLLATTPNLVVCTDCLQPSVSRDGRYVAFERPPAVDPAGVGNVYVKDMVTDQVLLVSENVSKSGGGNRRSYVPLMEGEGRWVVFSSEATDLTSLSDANNGSDIFLRDLTAGQTFMVSQNLAGTASGQRRSMSPILSGDGRVVVFRSFADDLTPGDYNGTGDIMALRISVGDADGDQLEDDWEQTYFGNLDHDGSGDADMDGHSDREEYLAGTDPTEEGSLLRVLTLTAASSGNVTVLWSSVPGQSYQVEVKAEVSGSGWQPLTGAIVAEGTTASAPGGSVTTEGQRYYRVRVLK